MDDDRPHIDTDEQLDNASETIGLGGDKPRGDLDVAEQIINIVVESENVDNKNG
jgi:hypothetical protein